MLGAVAVFATLADAAFGAVSVSKSFLDPNGFVAGSNEVPITQVNQGDPVVLAVSVINSGGLVTAGTLTDNLPSGMTVASSANIQLSSGCGAANTSGTAAGGTVVTYSGGQIPALVGSNNGVCTIYVSVRVTGPTGTGTGSVATLINQIPANTGYVATDGGSLTVPPGNDGILAFTQIVALKSALEPDTNSAAGSVAPGNQLFYEVQLWNFAPTALTNVAVNDPLPLAGGAQSVFLTLPAPVFSGCTGSIVSANGGSSAQFNNILIPAGTGTGHTVCSIRFWIQLPNNWSASTPITNTIPAGNITENGNPFTQFTPTSVTTPEVDRLLVAKSTSLSPIFQGQTSTATTTLTNNNYANVTAASVLDSPIFDASVAYRSSWFGGLQRKIVERQSGYGALLS